MSYISNIQKLMNFPGEPLLAANLIVETIIGAKALYDIAFGSNLKKQIENAKRNTSIAELYYQRKSNELKKIQSIHDVVNSYAESGVMLSGSPSNTIKLLKSEYENIDRMASQHILIRQLDHNYAARSNSVNYFNLTYSRCNDMVGEFANTLKILNKNKTV